MKKFLLVLVLAMIVSGAAFAEMDWLNYTPTLKDKNILLDFGVGLELGYDYDMLIPPIFVQVEYLLPMIPISVGGNLSFMRYGHRNGNWHYTYIIPSGRASWHFPFEVPNLDVYAGVSSGYRISMASHGYLRNRAGMTFDLHAGVHYYFTDMFGVTAETGWPYWIKAGLAFKF